MPSCSTSSNILSSSNTINITSGGSRLLVSIPATAGLTIGNVIRYDVATSGYTASIANAAIKSEVFGVIESYSPITDKLNVVLSGSINLPDSYLADSADDPSGGGGGKDIYFLSGTTAGLLQSLAPSNLNHVVKPVYQRAPHNNFTGSVVNYIGYKLGGDIQAAIDTNLLFAQVGSVQFIFNEAFGTQFDAYEDFYDSYWEPTNVTWGNVPSILSSDPLTEIEWNFEHIRVDDIPRVLRKVDFPAFTENIGPKFNSGWIERVKVQEGVNIPNTYQNKPVVQFNHTRYLNSSPDFWYGKILHWDSTNRYLYIQRPSLSFSFGTFTSNLMSQKLAEVKDLTVYDGTIPGNGSSIGTISLESINENLKFVGYFIANMRWTSSAVGETYPFSFTTNLYDPFGIDLNQDSERSSRIYMKVKNKGISVVIPETVNVGALTADTVYLNNALYDIQTKITEIENRLGNGNL